MCRFLGIVIACVALGGGVGATYSAFADEASNSSNSFEAATTFGCSNPGTQTVPADADSYVREDRANTNFGGATSLDVRSHDDDRNRRALVRFPLPAPPSRCTLTSATLRLNATAASGGRTIGVVRATSSWTEGGVTWNNQPSMTFTDAAITGSGTGWRQWGVTPLVESMYAGSNHGFLIGDASENSGSARRQTFSSREASTGRPELLITFE